MIRQCCRWRSESFAIVLPMRDELQADAATALRAEVPNLLWHEPELAQAIIEGAEIAGLGALRRCEAAP
jgi:hypothetical protein